MNVVAYTAWLFCVSFSLAGVQFVYSSQFALGGPLYTAKFHMDSAVTNIIMATAGPISGFIVQPIIGAISDKYTAQLGRRRWFIIVGSLFTAFGMIMIAFSVKIGTLMGEQENNPNSQGHIIAITISIAGLWIMNLFTNVIQGPARALVNDVTTQEKLQLANATTAGVMALSAIGANLVGAQFVKDPNPYYIIFLIGAGFVIFSMIPTVVAGKEIPYIRPLDEKKLNIKLVFYQIFKSFKEMPRTMTKVVLVYFLSWIAYTPLMVNQTLLFQDKVYPKNAPFGMEFSMYTSALFSTLSFIFSLVLSYIVKAIGSKATYVLTQALATCCFLGTWILEVKLGPNEKMSEWAVLTLASLTSFNFTAFNSIPFAITTEIVGSEKCGLYMGVLNSASVVAQTVSGGITAIVLGKMKDDYPAAIGVGGIISVLATFAALFIETAEKDKPLKNVNSSRDTSGLLPPAEQSINRSSSEI